MTREEAIKVLSQHSEHWKRLLIENICSKEEGLQTVEALDMAIKVLLQDPCENVISREDVLKLIYDFKEKHTEDRENHPINYGTLLDLIRLIRELPLVNSHSKTGYCKDCKWWKDSDGAYRRGVKAESQCPINRREVLESNGYCYVFEPQESEG